MWWTKKKKVKDDSIFTLRDKHQKFYQSKEWKKLRLVKLNMNPVCEICEASSGLTVVATVVNHRTSLTLRFDLRLSVENLESLCVWCHNRISVREKNEYRRMEQENVIDKRMSELNDFE
jgi:5-methylcytosine-specific restriction endonuclease McrA